MAYLRFDLSELAKFLDEKRAELLAMHDKLQCDKESRAETGIEAQVEMVGEFMARHFTDRQQLTSNEVVGDAKVTDELRSLASHLSRLCEECKWLYQKKDLRGSRCLKLLEELGELMLAMAQRDEVETLDALADMDYLVKGTAGLLDLPLAEAFTEVHRSNMTKAGIDDAASPDGRKTKKGPGYKPPDLLAILMAHRKEQLSPHRIVWDTEKKRPKCELCDMQLGTMFRDLRKYGRSKCFGRPTL